MANKQQLQKQKKYEQYVKSVTPTHSLPINMAKAFLTGGLICLLGQFILNTAQSMGIDQESAGSWCSLLLILLSVLLTGSTCTPKSENSEVPEVLSLSLDLQTLLQLQP